MGATAALSGASLANGYIQGQAIEAQGDYAKKVSDGNAKLIELRAEDEIIRGEADAVAYKKKVRKLRGSQRAAYGASGVDVNTGSAMLVQQETEEQGALDALTIKNNAWKRAWGLKQEASNERFSGELGVIAARSQANNTYATAGLDAFRYASSEFRSSQKTKADKKKEP
jgi:hypothetical protein